MALLVSAGKGWSQRLETSYAEFVFELETTEKTPFVIRAGRIGDRAFLQTAAASSGFYVRDMTISDLTSVLEAFSRDTSIALLLPDKGYYREMVDKALASQNSRVKSKELDGKSTRRLLGSIIQYSRLNPQDTDTSGVLRTLLSLTVDDFVPGWYAVQVEGCGYHCSARVLVSGSGQAMAASPQNCLSLCWSKFGTLDRRDNAKKVCEKVLEGSGRGKIVGSADEIPGYRKKPMPKEKERQIRPMYERRVGDRLSYGFYVYEQLGGRVWQCMLVVDETKPVWQINELAKDIGAASYIL